MLNCSIRVRKTTKYSRVKHNPMAIWVSIISAWLLNIGIQFCGKTWSIRPPPMLPTTLKRYITVDIEAASTACTANSNGEMNRKVNSSGSVIPTGMAVKVAGISKPATFTRFSGAAVKYIAKEMPTAPKIFELPCRAKPPSGNNDFSGSALRLNSCRCCAQYI